jgi:putative colanic acid biosynthesis acetyltransferase WcaB
MLEFVLQDWQVNAGNPKGRLVLAFFRLCQFLRHLPEPGWMLASPILLLYVVLVEWIMGIELGYRTAVGKRLRLYHASGLVVHPWAVIGDDVILRQGVTIGFRRSSDMRVPVLGNRVEVGCGASILGPITIGDGARIGAGSVVVKDVPAGATVIGNPARIVSSES